MRVKSVELSWFRGAGPSIVLEPNARSLVVYGSNGSGKSSFADAFEYVVSNGRIGHLAHEYSGIRQRLGLRNTHAPKGVPSKLNVEFENGASLSVTIYSSGFFSIEGDPPETVSIVQSWKRERLILRQDEVASFIHATKGEKYSALLPLLGLQDLEHSAANFRALRKALVYHGEMNQKKQRLADLKHAILKYIPDFLPATVNQVLVPLARPYLSIDHSVDPLDLIAPIYEAVQSRIRDAEPEQRRYLIIEQIHNQQMQEKLSLLIEAERAANLVFDQFIEQRLSVLEPVQNLLRALDAGANSIDCPACGQEIEIGRLVHHVQHELNALSRARDARNTAIRARMNFRAGINAIKNWTKERDFCVWVNAPERDELKQATTYLQELNLDDCDHTWDDETWMTIRRNIPLICSSLKAALDQVPPSSEQLVKDLQIISALCELPEIKRLELAITRLEALIDCLSDIETVLRDTIKARTRQTMGQVSVEIQRLWSSLHPDEPIEKVELYIPKDADKAIDICLKFFGVDQPSPRLTLSEGHRNSLGLCIFLALVKLGEYHHGPVILDDVVSSLDREHRGMVANVLLEEFADRQVILLTHDREWYAELRQRLPAEHWNFLTLRPWDNPSTGIKLSRPNGNFDDARDLISANPKAAGNQVRAIMDMRLAVISEKLGVRVPFVRGERNDRRTCVELLERMISEGKDRFRKRNGDQWVKYQAPIQDWQEARSLLVSWGNRASHTGTITAKEVEYLIQTCERALSHLCCPNCGKKIWFAGQHDRDRLQCLCGEIQWRHA